MQLEKVKSNSIFNADGSDWMIAGFVLMLVGYFLPWFKLPAAGLTLIGLDISEWLKFLPQFATGELPNRNIFYLPPLFLGLMLILWSMMVDHERGAAPRRSLFISAAGCLIALIAVPALEVLPLNGEKFNATDEWLIRLALIGLVFGLAIIRPWLTRIPASWLAGGIGVLALIGAVLPAWLLYLSRSAYIFWLRLTPTPGLGFALHLLGTVCVLWAVVALLFLKSEDE